MAVNAPSSSTQPSADSRTYLAARKVTWVSIAVNIVLTLLQIIVGFFGKSQALVADGLHSLSDLLSDFLVLYANRKSHKRADADHPYGHARFETAATLILGMVLIALGGALLWQAGMRLQSPQALQTVHPATLWVALLTLAAKEALFRYMIKVGKRVRSSLIMANAWHSRSDAASSLVVVIGIGGNLLGATFLDLLAAALVAFLIAAMGVKFSFDALSELVDTGLASKEVFAIRETLVNTPGVRGLHELRTRKMGNQALVDAHIQVAPAISVSEGHYIAERARSAVLGRHRVLDVMVHIDPEDDLANKPSAELPDRQTLINHLQQVLGGLPPHEKIALHYLDGKVEAEIFLSPGAIAPSGISARGQPTALTDDPYFRRIHWYQRAPL